MFERAGDSPGGCCPRRERRGFGLLAESAGSSTGGRAHSPTSVFYVILNSFMLVLLHQDEDRTPRRTHIFLSLVSVAHIWAPLTFSHAHACGSRHDWDALHICAH